MCSPPQVSLYVFIRETKRFLYCIVFPSLCEDSTVSFPTFPSICWLFSSAAQFAHGAGIGLHKTNPCCWCQCQECRFSNHEIGFQDLRVAFQHWLVYCKGYTWSPEVHRTMVAGSRGQEILACETTYVNLLTHGPAVQSFVWRHDWLVTWFSVFSFPSQKLVVKRKF